MPSSCSASSTSDAQLNAKREGYFCSAPQLLLRPSVPGLWLMLPLCSPARGPCFRPSFQTKQRLLLHCLQHLWQLACRLATPLLRTPMTAAAPCTPTGYHPSPVAACSCKTAVASTLPRMLQAARPGADGPGSGEMYNMHLPQPVGASSMLQMSLNRCLQRSSADLRCKRCVSWGPQTYLVCPAGLPAGVLLPVSGPRTAGSHTQDYQERTRL